MRTSRYKVARIVIDQRMDPNPERTDVQLLHSDDPRAFTVLYRRHVEAVHEWFQRRLEWAASDLTAETFARAWLHRRRFRDERDGSALPWLLGIGRNVLRESARRDRIETSAREKLGLPLDLASDDGYERVEERLSPRTALVHALDELPADQRNAVQLRIVEDLPYPEIARRLAIRPAAARLRVSRGLRRLATAVEEDR
jgi:RNA polymerase sigma-70 factor, ECF subfamily